MGRKQKNKKRVTLTLSEFNEEGGGDPELLSLPSAPKAPEEWDAVGGKPEYNSRGYRERLPGGPSGRGGDRGGRADFSGYGGSGAGGSDDVDHDWTRRGPIDGGHDDEGRPERDWSDMRRNRNAVDVGNEMPERDWNDMRRGPVESSFGGMGGGRNDGVVEERDWSQRIGPVESNDGSQLRTEANWSEARGGRVVESKFHPYDSAPTELDREPDWTQRRGPIEAATSKPPQGVNDDDWAAPRKGPVESEFEQQVTSTTVDERDWSERRGPVEANLPSPNTTFGSEERERDWSERRGPVEAVLPPIEQKQQPQAENSQHVGFGEINGDDDDDQDWSAVRSSPLSPSGNEGESAESRDSTTVVADTSRSEWTRRGPVRSKAEEAAEQQAVRQQQQQAEGDSGNFGGRGRGRHRRGGGSFGRNFSESESGSRFNSEQNIDQQFSGSGSWRRDGGTGVVSRGRRSRNSYGRPVSTGSEIFNDGNAEFGGERERDWGAARRSMPGGREAKPIETSSLQTATGTEDDVNSNDADNAHAKGKLKGRKDGGLNEEPKSVEDEKLNMENAEGDGGETGDGADAADGDEWTTVRGNSRREGRTSRRGIERERNGFNSSGRWRGSSRAPRPMGRSFERNATDGRKKSDRQLHQNRRGEGEFVTGSGFDRFNSLGIDLEAETDSGDIDVDVDGDAEEDAQVTKDHSVGQYTSVEPISPTNA